MSRSRMLKPSGWEAAGLNGTMYRFSVVRGLFLKANTFCLNRLRNVSCVSYVLFLNIHGLGRKLATAGSAAMSRLESCTLRH